MYLKLSEIRSSGFDGLSFRQKIDESLFNVLSERGVSITDEAYIEGIARLLDETVEVKAEVTAEAAFSCDRCAGDVRKKVGRKISFYRDITDFKGDEILLDEEISEALFSIFPLKNLCRDDCAGLCPVCGCDRNTENCCCEVKK